MKSVVRPMLFGILCSAAALACVLPTPGRAACHIESIELPVTMTGSRAIAMVGINGTQVPLTVDSGAFFSVLTNAAAAQLKLPLKRNSTVRVQGVTGGIDTQTTTVDKLQLFKSEIERVEFIVGGNEPGAGTMGLMGRNILSFADTEYDLAHGVIRFLFPNSDCDHSGMAYWAGATPVNEVELLPGRNKYAALRVEIKLNGSKAVALLDSGATSLVSARAARRAKVPESDWKRSGTVYGGGRGSAQMWAVPFERFELGDETVSHDHLAVADFEVEDSDMLLGIDFFLSHRIYVSQKQSKLFITYNGGPVFALDRTGDATAAIPQSDAPGGGETPTAEQFARRGAASASRREFDRALADLDQACALEPTSAAWFVQRGGIHLALKQPAKAAEDFDRALELDPGQVDARLQRALRRLAAKDRDGAKADLDALDRTLAPQAQMRLALSQFYLTLEQPAEALVQLNQWLPAHPDEVRRDGALSSRCWARLLLGIELDLALDDCDDAIRADGKNPGYFEIRGWVGLRMGKDKKALSDFDRSLELRPASASARYGRGLAKTRIGDDTEGAADVAAARQMQPDIDRRMASRMGLTTAPVTKLQGPAAPP